MSTTVCTYPIVGAVRKVDDILGPDRNWSATHPMQHMFLRDLYTGEALAELACIPELESIASKSHTDINRWLAERKFTIKLDRFPKDGFGTACMLDVAVQWLVTGEVRKLPGLRVPGVFLKEGVTIWTPWKSPLGTVARILTKTGDLVSMALFANGKGLEGFDLLELVSGLKCAANPDFAGVHFPMVDLDEQPDISWLQGMNTIDQNSEPWLIAQAKQQTKFKMNQFGARVKSAAAIGLMRSSAQRPKPPLVIDGPLLLWIERPGLTKPFLVAHITKSEMKDPGDLSDM